jgi:hypothetical protein
VALLGLENLRHKSENLGVEQRSIDVVLTLVTKEVEGDKR